MTVLYAEDDIEDFNLFCEVLESFSSTAECINVRNGLEAIRFLENAPVLPDYVFIDINMPAMDGKACLKNIKKDNHLKSIPVIIYTTSRNSMDMELCKQLGAVDYLVKPNSVSEAKQSLAKYFQ